ncbi:ATP-dependent Clp protease proteolytic subunit [Laribacter hongkongensis HLHK9]|uniref:ATP-dependent Clp protease proteolytic subunit n=1 Tax=Laribacter hongkongensis (strain HLHK9) TaxID=557598 RepID=C1D8G7_LARHH|nr:head maturation protease, ClpP-related [Laribacter hongkongensis]ACO74757.1 ATP-dependent Clp protease proteolytic subunit [Laribacter hongkongensis HLHK9]MCG9081563.1 Clp protease ClpP [Laribacter hongkongensis]
MASRLNKLLADNRKAAARKFEVLAKQGGDEAEIFLYDAIVSSQEEADWYGGVAPEAFVKAVRGIDAGTIHLRINSPGGSVFAARAMEQALREHKARIVVHIDGIAASAATFIAMAGDEIVMNKGAMFMIHKAWTWTAGNADDLAKEAGLLAKIDGTLAQTYADRTGKDVETINGWMADETWFTADEAVEYGFADKLAETEARAEWNLSAYAHAPAMPAARHDDPAPDPDPETTLSDDHRARQRQRVQIAARL